MNDEIKIINLELEDVEREVAFVRTIQCKARGTHLDEIDVRAAALSLATIYNGLEIDIPYKGAYARMVSSFLKNFFNLSGGLRACPALNVFGGAFVAFFALLSVWRGEVNLSRTSLSPHIVRFAEHPLFFSLVMLAALVFAGFLFQRALSCMSDKAGS